MITHPLPLEDINQGFDLMPRGESIRGVVVYCSAGNISRRAARAPAHSCKCDRSFGLAASAINGTVNLSL